MAKSARPPKVSREVSPRPQAPGPSVVTLKVSVDPEILRLLKVEALGRGCSLGQVVSEAVRSMPRRFVLSERSRGQSAPSVPVAPGAPPEPPGVASPRLAVGPLVRLADSA